MVWRSVLKVMLPSRLKRNHFQVPNDELKNTKCVIAAWSILFTHMAYLIIFKLEQPYADFHDNTILRWLSIATCLLLACSDYWQEKFKWLLPWSQRVFLLSNCVFIVYLFMCNIQNQDTSSLAWMISVILIFAICAVLFTNIWQFLFHLLLINVISQGIYFWIEGHYFSYSFSQDPELRAFLNLLPVGVSFIGAYQGVAKLKMEYRSRLLRAVAASIAHEMRNPLAQLHGSLQLMHRQLCQIDGAKPVVSYHVNNAQRVIDQALQQIDITLDSVSDRPIDSSKFRLLSAQALVAEAVAEYAYEKIERAKSISVAGEDFKLVAEPVMFKYIIFNLLQNALWFTKTQHDGKIEITLKATGNKNIIQIRDNGPGIAADAISQLFDNFYTSDKQGGTGLGLFYCKRTMLAFGGDITCESELGQYTLFILSFPTLARRKSEQARHFQSQQVQNLPSNGPPVGLLCLSEKTVLIVDDDQLNRTLIKGILHSWDIGCLEAGNGQEALEILNINHCDLILTDMQMPLMDGLELVQKIRNREHRVGDICMPIIALTAEGDNVIKTATRLGANDHLIKPITAENVLPKLQRWLSG